MTEEKKLIKELDLKILKNLKDFFIIRNAISLSVNDHHTDILVRMNIPENSFLRNLVEKKLSQIIPLELDKANFVWGESNGPNTIPIYDLILKKADINFTPVIEKSINLFEPYTPMKPAKMAFYDLNKITEVLI